MRILIVEDQEIILTGIRKMIAAEIDAEITCMLSGEAALEYIDAHAPPDLILSDIVMYGMDGLSFIEQASRRLPFCRFVVISGYDDFSFAQRAIRLGISDYLLKPIDRVMLLDGVHRVQQVCMAEQAARSDVCMSAFRDLCRVPEANIGINGVHTKGCSVAFYVIRTQDALPEELPGCYPVGGDEYMRLYLMAQQQEVFDAAHEKILAMLPGKVYCGMDRDGHLCAALRQCAVRYSNRFFENLVPNFDAHQALRRIKEALELQDARAAALELYNELAQASGPGDKICACVQDAAKLLLDDDGFSAEALWCAAESYSVFLNEVRAKFDTLNQHHVNNSLFVRIKHYVDAHCDQPMNVKTVAASVAISPNYASTIFKQETGESLAKYIRKKQLEVAYNLLEASDMRIYEIAEQLGYQDERYFSTVFKTIYHLLPAEVRSNARKGLRRR